MSDQDIQKNGLKALREQGWFWLVLALAFVLRLLYALSLDPLGQYITTGDAWWYLDHGYKLVQGTVAGPPPSAPLYLILPGIAQQLFGAGSAGAVIFLWVLQALMGAATSYFAYRLALALVGDRRAGLLAAAVLAVSPVFVMEAGQILTETLYIFLASGGLLAYVAWVSNAPSRRDTIDRVPTDPLPTGYRENRFSPYAYPVLVGLILGLATLTRAVLLLFPLGLALHLLLVFGFRPGLKRALVMLVVYALVCSTWTIYNLVRWDYPVIGAQGISAFLFIGSEGWKAPDEIDASLAATVGGGQLPSDPKDQQQLYQEAAAQSILGDIPGYLRRRAQDLTEAFLQPHGTVAFGGESLKALVGNWWTTDRTLGGLLRLTEGDQFWPKLVIYLFYYTGVIAGLVGLWLTRRNWRVMLPLAGFIVYTLLVHFVLDALPRYLFPISMVWWVFAAVALVAVWDKLRGRRRVASVSRTPEGYPASAEATFKNETNV